MRSTPLTKLSMQHSKVHPVFIHMAAALASALLLAVLISPAAHAQSSGGTTGGPSQTSNTIGGPSQTSNQAQAMGQTIANPLKYSTLNDLLSAVLKAAIQIGSIVLTLAIVFVGFRFVAARGNEEKIRSARTALMWTIIGGLILLGATAIQSVITTTVGNITT